MKPILYSAGTTDFTGKGLGVLYDTVSAEVTEERNGKFELELEYPVGSTMASQLVLGNIIAVKVGLDGRPNQAFEIYKVTKDLGGIITVNAQHITYKASQWYYDSITTYGGDTVEKAIKRIVDSKYERKAGDDSPFTATSDYTISLGEAGYGVESIDGPHSLKSMIWPVSSDEPAEIEGYWYAKHFNVLEIFQITEADIVPDNYNIGVNVPKEWEGLTFRYGVNIKDFTSELDASDTINGVVGFVLYDSSGAHMCTMATNPITPVGTSPVNNYELVDFTDEFDTPSSATPAQIQTKVDNYITQNGYTGIPEANIKIDYVDGTGLEKACLLDKVKVLIPGLDVDIEETIVKVVFDALTERIDSLELGKLKTYIIGG